MVQVLNARAGQGLSPRVRGNRLPPPVSIINAVYPRVCGGTRRGGRNEDAAQGLSPRVRGNLPDFQQQIAGHRSIPACAGEPDAVPRCAEGGTVYPRVCGGTAAGRAAGRRMMGLSPRVRGNPRPARSGGTPHRSIPACAGEPDWRQPHLTIGMVYPRVCGGTCGFPRASIRANGLSPRVRGNRVPHGGEHLPQGSIPACAGEPAGQWASPMCREVYPRVCGGTAS